MLGGISRKSCDIGQLLARSYQIFDQLNKTRHFCTIKCWAVRPKLLFIDGLRK